MMYPAKVAPLFNGIPGSYRRTRASARYRGLMEGFRGKAAAAGYEPSLPAELSVFMAPRSSTASVPQTPQRFVGVACGQAGEIVGGRPCYGDSVSSNLSAAQRILVAQTPAQRVQGQCAALCNAVVEHVSRSRDRPAAESCGDSRSCSW